MLVIVIVVIVEIAGQIAAHTGPSRSDSIRSVMMMVVIIIVMFAAHLRAHRCGAGVIVTEECVLDRCVALFERSLDFFGQTFDFRGELLAGGEPDIGFSAGGATRACDSSCYDRQHDPGDKKCNARPEQPERQNFS